MTWEQTPSGTFTTKPTGWWVTPDPDDYVPTLSPWLNSVVKELNLGLTISPARAATLVKIGMLALSRGVPVARSLGLTKIGMLSLSRSIDLAPAATLTKIGTLSLSRSVGVSATATLSYPPTGLPAAVNFTVSGSYTIPRNADYIDIICLGGGQGGGPGTGAVTGAGGAAGSFSTVTYQRGVDIPISLTALTVVVGAGGTHSTGNWPNPGNSGVASTVTAVGMTMVSGAGGTGGGGGLPGIGPGTISYNGNSYVGGTNATGTGTDGNAPGGAGSGGAAFFNAGGDGAAGKVWFYAYQ